MILYKLGYYIILSCVICTGVHLYGVANNVYIYNQFYLLNIVRVCTYK